MVVNILPVERNGQKHPHIRSMGRGGRVLFVQFNQKTAKAQAANDDAKVVDDEHVEHNPEEILTQDISTGGPHIDGFMNVAVRSCANVGCRFVYNTHFMCGILCVCVFGYTQTHTKTHNIVHYGARNVLCCVYATATT